jgi:hypothetical protein
MLVSYAMQVTGMLAKVEMQENAAVYQWQTSVFQISSPTVVPCRL